MPETLTAHEHAAQRELIERAIAALSADGAAVNHTDLAVLLLTRDARTLRRWLAGEHRLPDVVADLLRDLADAPEICEAARGLLTARRTPALAAAGAGA